MNASLKYDIEARAFNLMTGLMAPGKDSPDAAGPSRMNVRQFEWEKWLRENGPIIRAMMKAFEEHTD